MPGNWPAWFGPGAAGKGPAHGRHLASGLPVCHARLSTWLNAGVAPAQVAEWAGNSVPVLLRVYAKCLTDSEQTALRRIEEAEAKPDKDPQAE